MTTPPDDITALSYEQARDELVRVVNELEQGSSTLEDALALWERGEALARRCEEWLIGAKARLDAARAVLLSDATKGTMIEARSLIAQLGGDVAAEEVAHVLGQAPLVRQRHSQHSLPFDADISFLDFSGDDTKKARPSMDGPKTPDCFGLK